jgi:hypothetical protein
LRAIYLTNAIVRLAKKPSLRTALGNAARCRALSILRWYDQSNLTTRSFPELLAGKSPAGYPAKSAALTGSLLVKANAPLVERASGMRDGRKRVIVLTAAIWDMHSGSGLSHGICTRQRPIALRRVPFP